MTGIKFNWTEEQLSYIKNKYLEGEGCTQIAKELGICSWSTINQLIKTMGIQRPISFDKQTEELICKDYLDGNSIRFIEKKYGSTYPTIIKILKRNNIIVKSRKINKETEEIICSEYKSGNTVRGISRKYNLERRTIQHCLLRNNIQIIGTTALNHISLEIQELIKLDLLSKQYFMRELVKKYSVSSKVIRKISAKDNIPFGKPIISNRLKIFTQEESKDILDTYSKSETILSLSNKYQCSTSTIKNFLVKNDIKIETEVNRDLLSRNKYINTISPDIIKMYKNNDSIHKIMKHFRMSYEKVLEVLNNNQIPIKIKGFYTRIVFEEEIVNEICEKYKNGQTIGKLCLEYEVSHPTLLNILKLNNINTRERMSSFLSKNNNRRSSGISGYYNGFYFRSMNELSFIINYAEKKNITIISGEDINRSIPYEFEGKSRKYFPDFYFNDLIIEIKPKRLWNNLDVQAKLKAAEIFAELNNLKYRLVDYPVIINPIISLYNKNEILFTDIGLEKFLRIYKKQLMVKPS